MNLLELTLLAILATYRITFLLNSESGPGQIFTRFRTRIGVRFDQHSNPYGSNWLAEGVLCFFCLSVWIGTGLSILGVLAILAGHPLVFAYAVLPFAASGGAVFLKKWAG